MSKIQTFAFSLIAACAISGGGGAALLAAAALPSRVATKRRQASTRPAPSRDGQSLKTAGANAGSKESPPKPSVRAVKDTELKTLLGESATKGRPLLVNFWATWCEPCRVEFPDLVKLDAKYHARGLDFAFVSLDDISDIETGVPDFLRQMRATRMSAYLLNADDQDVAINMIDPAWHGELPATFLYDRRGQLAYTHKGIIKLAELQAAVERVLGAK
ncbi:MAG: TlpA disulfide reductase family protein [Pyrinomonadaceae bacterium]